VYSEFSTGLGSKNEPALGAGRVVDWILVFLRWLGAILGGGLRAALGSANPVWALSGRVQFAIERAGTPAVGRMTFEPWPRGIGCPLETRVPRRRPAGGQAQRPVGGRPAAL
jgi:hypothetical protein